jgi:hypothetical protein
MGIVQLQGECQPWEQLARNDQPAVHNAQDDGVRCLDSGLKLAGEPIQGLVNVGSGMEAIGLLQDLVHFGNSVGHGLILRDSGIIPEKGGRV